MPEARSVIGTIVVVVTAAGGEVVSTGVPVEVVASGGAVARMAEVILVGPDVAIGVSTSGKGCD
jgi:hypothetical protein